MNQRSLELALQAGLKKEHGSDREYTGDFDWREFAELLVQECAEVCYSHSNAAGGVRTDFGYAYKDCGDDIKRHFGIES
jgi:hypothetical protein